MKLRAAKIRLDALLVGRGHFPSREQAQRAILAGEISSPGEGGRRLDKPGVQVAADLALTVTSVRPRFVSRGGWKLEAALEHFNVRPTGQTCLDVGASTGGFTDCLLQRGATRVYAIDVGHGQLAWSLRQDARVVVREKMNARGLQASDFPEPISLAVIDVSFISLRLVLPAVARVVSPLPSPGAAAEDTAGTIIALIKPQFELGRVEVSRGSGVIRDPAAHARAVSDIEAFVRSGGGAAREEVAGSERALTGWEWVGVIPSPLFGADGNTEFLACLRKSSA